MRTLRLQTALVKHLTQVPDFAMDMAISHMVNAAKDQGVDTIDSAFLDANNPMG